VGRFSTVGGIGYIYIVSNDVLHANDSEKNFSTTTYTKFKEIQIVKLPSPAVLRVYFEIRSSDSSITTYGRIYRNGSAYGTERSTTSTSYVSFTEDLAFWSGDYVQLYCKTSVVNIDYPSYVRNFRILGKIAQAPSSPANVFTATNTVT